jgi:hypothetical protein
MKHFTITYTASGGIDIEAETEEEAKKLFDEMSDKELYDEIEPNSIECSGIYEEEI